MAQSSEQEYRDKLSPNSSTPSSGAQNVNKSADAAPYVTAMPSRQSVLNNQNLGNKDLKSSTNTGPAEEVYDVRTYDWTYSKNKNSNIDEIPYIEMKEFKIAGNSYMSSLMTSALLFPDAADTAGNAASNISSSLNEKIKSSFSDNKFAEFMNNIGNKVKDVGSQLASKTEPYVKETVEKIKGLDKSAQAWLDKDLINKYAYLYIRKETGKKYIFPHFDDEYIKIQNSFSDTYNTKDEGVIGKTLKGIQDFSDKISSAVSVAEPGMYIQRPKFYQFKEEGFSVSIEFYLYNTLSENAYLKNIELITKLVIQNTPHRHNRILVDPPCIYELTVPGRGFFPYSYISSLQVNHVGTRRSLSSSIGNSKTITVPDAFKITIELKSLTSDVNNFFIPEMGSGGIDVNKRYGLTELIKEQAEKNKIEKKNSILQTNVTPR
jgi:hypothetical protein